jgi:ABC-type dipeptide/oligopeptide/nickel transport system permease component
VQVMMLALGAWLVINGEATAGVMIATSTLLGRALAPVEQIVGSWRILAVHQLRPALVPVAAYLGTAAAYLLTGSVVIEQVFQVPGLGSEMIQAAMNRDHNLVMALTMLFGTAVILCNLAADVVVMAIDPRARRA